MNDHSYCLEKTEHVFLVEKTRILETTNATGKEPFFLANLG